LWRIEGEECFSDAREWPEKGVQERSGRLIDMNEKCPTAEERPLRGKILLKRRGDQERPNQRKVSRGGREAVSALADQAPSQGTQSHV
jgi:hypothetical protein